MPWKWRPPRPGCPASSALADGPGATGAAVTGITGAAGRAGRARRGERGVVVQDLALEVADAVRRIDAQLVDQPSAQVVDHPQRLGLAPRAVQGDGEVLAQAFAHRVVGDEVVQLADDEVVTAEQQVDADAVLQRGESALVQPRGDATRPRLLGDVLQGRAVPQRQRRGERGVGLGGAAVLQQRPAAIRPGGEDAGVDEVVADVEAVAARLEHQPGALRGARRGAQRPTQAGHVALQRARRR